MSVSGIMSVGPTITVSVNVMYVCQCQYGCWSHCMSTSGIMSVGATVCLSVSMYL